MQNIDQKLSARIANMAWVCAVLVVYIHIWPLMHCMGDSGKFVLWLSRKFLTPCAVPSFFLMAGWFLGAHMSEPGWYPQVLKSRVRTILVPFLLIGVIDWLCKCGIGIAQNLHAGHPWHESITLLDFITGIGLNPFAFPGHQVFWFLRSLMLTLLISPLILWLLTGSFRVQGRVQSSWRGWIVIALTMAAHGIISTQVADPYHPGPELYRTTLNTGAPAMVMFGIWARITGICMVGTWRRTLALWAATGALYALLYFGILPGYLGQVLWPAQICLMFFALLGTMPPIRVPFAWTSFPMYSIHTFFSAPLFMMGQAQQKPGGAEYIFLGVTVVVISVLAAYGMRRVAPRFSAILFGGRV